MATPVEMTQAPPSQSPYRTDGLLTRVSVSTARSLPKSRLACKGRSASGGCGIHGGVTGETGYRWDCGRANPSAYVGWGPQARMTLADRTDKLLGCIASTAPDCDEWLQRSRDRTGVAPPCASRDGVLCP